jgi:HEAT repeat protein
MKHMIVSLFVLISFMMPVVSGCSSEPKINTDEAISKARGILNDNVKEGSRATRDTIVRLTGGMVAEEALPLLEITVKDPDSAISDKSLKKILEFRDPSSAAILKEKLGDKYDQSILDVLVEVKSEGIVPNIEKGLKSLRPLDRASAITSLQKIEGEKAKEQIRQFVQDEELIVQLKAKHALIALGEKEYLSEVRDLLDSGEIVKQAEAVDLIGEFELKDYRDDLVKIASEKTGPQSDQALRILYKWNDPKASEIMNQRLENPGGMIISLYGLLAIIDEYKDKSTIPALKKFMSSSVPGERYSAARMILSIDAGNNPDLLKFILTGMESEVPPAVREQVAISLGKLPGIAEVKKTLEKKGLKDESPKVIEASIIALGKVGDKNSIKYIAEFLDDDNFELRATAAAAILNISKGGFKEKPVSEN